MSKFLYNLRSRLFGIPGDFLHATGEFKKGYEEIQDYKKAKALLIYDGRARVVDAVISDDLAWVVPKGFNLRFKNSHSLILEPENVPYFLCYIENPQTIDLLKRPTLDEVDRDHIDMIEEKGKTIKVYDIEKFKIVGGRVLSEISYQIGVTGLLKYIEPPSKKEILYIAVISGLFCFILGIFFAMWWF